MSLSLKILQKTVRSLHVMTNTILIEEAVRNILVVDVPFVRSQSFVVVFEVVSLCVCVSDYSSVCFCIYPRPFTCFWYDKL